MKKLLKEYIIKREMVQLKKILEEETPINIAEFLESNINSNDDLLFIFRLLHKETGAEVFANLSPEYQKKIVELITDDNLKLLLEKLYFDDMIDFIEEMPSNVVKRVLENTKPENRTLINQFLSYEEDSAGSLMTIEYLSIKSNWSVKNSLDYVRKNAKYLETIDVAYVIGDNKKLEGFVTLKKLLSSSDEKIISEIIEKKSLYVKTDTNQEEAIKIFKKYDLTVLPVLDKENILVGIITIDDMVDIIEEENTEDLQKMAAMTPSKEEYINTSVFTLAKNRFTWLLVLMITDTITGSIIRSYEVVLEKMIVLTAAIPMLMDTGGNAGSQSSTLVIRGLALGEIKTNDIFKIIWKEFRVGIISSIGLASVNFVRMYFLVKNSFKISLLVSITLSLVVILAKIVGGILPVLAKKLKLDPAIMTGPLVTTIVDAFSLLTYFYLAIFMFRDILG